MRDQEDQMDHGSIGATRGSSHVRIPQRRINRSLRSGVTPSMQQPTAGNGQFQNGVNISPRVQPIRQMGPARGRLFHQFMQRANPRPPMEGNQGLGGHNGATDPRFLHMQGGHPPMGFPRPGKVPYQNGGRPSMGGPNTHFPTNQPPNGGQPPIGPVGQPVLGHGQTMNGMIQAIMDDLGQGINPAQFANMQAGTLPGHEGGDFLRALGGGDMNNNPLQALVQHLIQGQPGADGAPGNYMINGDQGGAIAQILRHAIRQNPNFNPPPPPPGLFGNGGRGGRRGNRFMPPNPWQGGPFNTSGGYPAPMPLMGNG